MIKVVCGCGWTKHNTKRTFSIQCDVEVTQRWHYGLLQYEADVVVNSNSNNSNDNNDFLSMPLIRTTYFYILRATYTAYVLTYSRT